MINRTCELSDRFRYLVLDRVILSLNSQSFRLWERDVLLKSQILLFCLWCTRSRKYLDAKFPWKWDNLTHPQNSCKTKVTEKEYPCVADRGDMILKTEPLNHCLHLCTFLWSQPAKKQGETTCFLGGLRFNVQVMSWFSSPRPWDTTG